MALAIHAPTQSSGIHLQVLNSYDLNGDIKYEEPSLCTSCKIKAKSFLCLKLHQSYPIVDHCDEHIAKY